MANMAALTGTGSVVTGSAQTFATNVLEITVATGNPGAIQTLADLARPGVRVVLADPSLPAGRDAREALIRAHVTLAPKSLELQVAVVLTKVQTGDADAGIAYRSDLVTAGPGVTGVAIPAPDNVEASYAIAPLTSTPNPDVARAYIQFVLSAEGQSILRAAGFLPPAP